MKQQPGSTAVHLDGLLSLVEKAVSTIERLQTENAALVQQVQELETAATAAASEAAAQTRRIEDLEQARLALQRDADWCRWFRKQYQDSTFFLHIERTYLNRHDEKNNADTNDSDTIRVNAPPTKPDTACRT